MSSIPVERPKVSNVNRINYHDISRASLEFTISNIDARFSNSLRRFLIAGEIEVWSLKVDKIKQDTSYSYIYDYELRDIIEMLNLNNELFTDDEYAKMKFRLHIISPNTMRYFVYGKHINFYIDGKKVDTTKYPLVSRESYLFDVHNTVNINITGRVVKGSFKKTSNGMFRPICSRLIWNKDKKKDDTWNIRVFGNGKLYPNTAFLKALDGMIERCQLIINRLDDISNTDVNRDRKVTITSSLNGKNWDITVYRETLNIGNAIYSEMYKLVPDGNVRILECEIPSDPVGYIRFTVSKKQYESINDTANLFKESIERTIKKIEFLRNSFNDAF